MSGLWPLLYVVGFLGKYLQRPIRWAVVGPQAVGKTTWWNLLKKRLNPTGYMRRKPTEKPGKQKTYRVYLEDSDRKHTKIKGADFPHYPEKTAQQIQELWPTDLTLVIDLETVVRGKSITGDTTHLMSELKSFWQEPFTGIIPWKNDPIIDHIQAILSGLSSEFYRRKTAEWLTMPFPGTIFPWQLLQRDGWTGIHLRGSRELKDFHLFFNKIDLIPQDKREKYVVPIVEYYEQFLFGSTKNPTFLTHLMEENELRYHQIATCLVKNWYVPYEELGGMHYPMSKYLTKVVNDKDA